MNSVYIHIPFCNTICSYCDFSKMYYKSDIVDKYLDALKMEILNNYKGDIIKTIYIGGGTPSVLNITELNKLFKILKVFKLDKNVEFTFECNIENIDEDKILFLKKNNVNRLSIGIQTTNSKYIKYLNRNHNRKMIFEKINLIKEIGFENINVDLMYGFKNQTLEELKEDVNTFLELDINHISTYSLIIEPHTKLYIENEKNIDEDLEYEMYKYINKRLKENNFINYEVSNYSKEGFESKHNLTYWNNEYYYGFGLGSGGYIDDIRYLNTRNINSYLNGNYKLEEEIMDKKIKMENEMILGLRKINGVNTKLFKEKYNCDIIDIYEINDLIEEGKLVIENDNIKINEDYIYLSNEILVRFIGE